VDLLASVAMAGVLGVLLVASMGLSRSGPAAIRCLSGQRQLARATLMYCADQQGRFPLNGGTSDVADSATSGRYSYWANNVMTWSASASWMDQSNTNQALLAKGPLASYLDDLGSAFKCPADRYVSPQQRARGWGNRVRSRSMNGFLGTYGTADAASSQSPPRNWLLPSHRQFPRLTHLPRPASNFVFLDEHPDSINDGYFINQPGASSWGDLPAAYHEGGAGIAYADGRAEIHRWRSEASRLPVRYQYVNRPFDAAGREDFAWYAARVPFVPVR
jgi:prepilin-type processing-associated H-X9-DG protein